jgi:hypothetical protein
VDVAGLFGSLEDVGGETDLRPALALLAGRDIVLEGEDLNAARRRAMLLLAAGGDPHRALELDGRAVRALASELDEPDRRAALELGLRALEPDTAAFQRVSEALAELVADPELAWRAYACALLAEELDD